MKKLFVPFVALGLGMGFCACGHADEAHHDADKNHNATVSPTHDHDGEIMLDAHQQKAADIQTITLRPMAFTPSQPVGGRIRSAVGDEQTLTALQSGIVHFTQASLAEGAAVGAGQTVAVVSADKLPEGNPVAMAKAEYEAAKAELERAKPLLADRIVSEKEYVQLRLQYEKARLAYEAVSRGQTAGGKAVVAPKAGFVKSLLATDGQYVAVGTPIMVVTACRRLQLCTDVPVDRLEELVGLKSARFRPAGSERVYSLEAMNGRLVGRPTTVSDGAAYATVTFEMDNVGGVVPGSFAEVWLLSDGGTETLTIPLTAVGEEAGVKVVFVEIHPGAYERREVNIGRSDGERIEVKSGLKTGEKVVVKGVTTLRLASQQTAIPAHSHNH